LFAADHYKRLALSSISAFFSVSNVLFWKGAGYFDESSELNPLLHTWSLGVEQQFYLAWPIVIYCMYRIRPALIPYAIATLATVSLAASQWFTTIDPSANYFLAPFRVFEFAIGGSLIWIQRYIPQRNGALESILFVGL